MSTVTGTLAVHYAAPYRPCVCRARACEACVRCALLCESRCLIEGVSRIMLHRTYSFITCIKQHKCIETSTHRHVEFLLNSACNQRTLREVVNMVERRLKMLAFSSHCAKEVQTIASSRSELQLPPRLSPSSALSCQPHSHTFSFLNNLLNLASLSRLQYYYLPNILLKHL